MRRRWLLAAAAIFAISIAMLPRPAPAAGDDKVVLGDDAVAKLVATKDSSDPNVRYEFRGGFNAKPGTAKDGGIVVRVHCALYKITKAANGRGQSYARVDGTAKFYLQDEAGKVVMSGSEPLESMCPT